MDTCKTCKNVSMQSYGCECHRNPPHPIHGWPGVTDGAWCSKYESADRKTKNIGFSALLYELHKLHDAARDSYVEAFFSRQDAGFCEWLLDVGKKVGEHIGRIEEES